MKLVAQIQLLPQHEAQGSLLRSTLIICNQACSWLAQEADKIGVYRQYDLHYFYYDELRTKFNLTAQVAVRCIHKVSSAFASAKQHGKNGSNEEIKVRFRKYAAQPYDSRIFRFKQINDDGGSVSIWCYGGRQVMSFACGERQRELLKHRAGEVDLQYVRGKFYLLVTCDVPEAIIITNWNWIGVDMGINNIATTYDGVVDVRYCGAFVDKRRTIYENRRAHHQRRAATARKRTIRRQQRKKLIALSGREARFKRNTNHVISKQIVANAERTVRGIVLEDLTDIRNRVTAKAKQRGRLSKWAFAQLRTFIEYKAMRVGIPIKLIDPAYTSQMCNLCHHIDKLNRPDQSTFKCDSCGYAEHADLNAARNIRILGFGS